MNWGIIGYGEVAPTFIEGLGIVENQRLAGIASVSKHGALLEQNTYPETTIYSSYASLLASPTIDIVYVCTTNQLHKENVISALRAGKHVLCEKPLGVCRLDVEEMVLEAKKQKRFLMEGMWTKFLPFYRHFKDLLGQRAIGTINFARIDFGFFSDWGDERRLKNKALFGGTLLDNADYNIFLCEEIFGEQPTKISAFARFYETGVDDLCGVMFQYPNGSIAQLFSTFQLKTNQEALIYGEKGHIHLKPFWNGTTVALYKTGEGEYWDFPFKKNGFEYEIEHVVDSVKNKQVESEIIPHKLSIEIAHITDEILKRIKA
jgi:predicted dehydrogenase